MAKASGKKKVFRKKEKKNVPVGIAHIAASFNNTMISITDLEGNLDFVDRVKELRLPRSKPLTKPLRRPTKQACSSARFV